jgi:hypothetical protein
MKADCKRTKYLLSKEIKNAKNGFDNHDTISIPTQPEI